MMPRDTLATIFLYFVGGVMLCAALLVLVSFLQNEDRSPAAHADYPPEIVLDPGALTAHAAVVYDPLTKRVLFAKNASESLALASLTKLMAAEAVLSKMGLETSITITPEALRPEGDSGLRLGERWSIRELLTLGLVASSNDAMAAAVGSLGEDAIEGMNATANRLGLTETYFLNGTGLDLTTEISGAYGSARDVAVLAATFLKRYPEFFEASTKQTIVLEVGGRTIEATSTAGPLLGISGLVGAKTGYTDLAGGNLVAAFDIAVGHPLVAVVLNSTRQGRFEDIQTLITAARAAAQPHP